MLRLAEPRCKSLKNAPGQAHLITRGMLMRLHDGQTAFDDRETPAYLSVNV